MQVQCMTTTDRPQRTGLFAAFVEHAACKSSAGTVDLLLAITTSLIPFARGRVQQRVRRDLCKSGLDGPPRACCMAAILVAVQDRCTLRCIDVDNGGGSQGRDGVCAFGGDEGKEQVCE